MTVPSVEISAPAAQPPAKAPAPAKPTAPAPPAAAPEPPAAPAAAPVAPPAAAVAPASAPPPPPPSQEKKRVDAPANSLAVFPLDAPADLALIGRSLAEAIAQEISKAGGFDVVAPAAVFERLGPDRAGQVSHCGEAIGCYQAPATQLGVARVIGGWIDRAGTNYRFGLVLVDAKAGKSVGRVQREVPIASRRIRTDVVAAALPLLRGEAATTGSLAVLTEQPGADVRIDDKAAGKTPLETKLPAGKHKVEVAQRGKVRIEPFWVEVQPNARAEHRVRLYDIPLAERKPGEVETTTFEMGKDKKRKR